MVDAYIVGVLYALLGAVLLFFGAKFLNVVLGVFGGLLGINIGQLLVIWLGIHGYFAFVVVVLCVAVLAYLAVKFFKIVIAGGTSYFLGILAYAVMTTWHVSHTWAVVVGILTALVSFAAIWRLNAVEKVFKFITSVQGATALVGGVYILFNTTLLDVLQTNRYDVLLGASFWWVLFWIIAFAAGFGYQLSTKTALSTERKR